MEVDHLASFSSVLNFVKTVMEPTLSHFKFANILHKLINSCNQSEGRSVLRLFIAIPQAKENALETRLNLSLTFSSRGLVIFLNPRSSTLSSSLVSVFILYFRRDLRRGFLKNKYCHIEVCV